MKKSFGNILLGLLGAMLVGCGGGGNSTSAPAQNLSPQHLVGPGSIGAVVTIDGVDYPAIPEYGIEAASGQMVIELPDNQALTSHTANGEAQFDLPGGHGGPGHFTEVGGHTEGYPVAYNAIAASNLNFSELAAEGQLMYRCYGFMYSIQSAEYSDASEEPIKQTFESGGYMTYFTRKAVLHGIVENGTIKINDGTCGEIPLSGKPVTVTMEQWVLIEMYDPNHLQEDQNYPAPR